MAHTARQDYAAAVGYFLASADEAAAGDLDGPGLGVWSRRELIAHTARALSTVVDYLVEDVADPVEVESAAGYYATLVGVDHDAVAERGRQAAAAAGDDLPGHVHRLADAALAAVAGASPQAKARTLGGLMWLDDYLPTRTLELVVHSLDLRPSRLPEPDLLASLWALLGELAAERGLQAEAIRAVTGRPGGFSLLP